VLPPALQLLDTVLVRLGGLEGVLGYIPLSRSAGIPRLGLTALLPPYGRASPAGGRVDFLVMGLCYLLNLDVPPYGRASPAGGMLGLWAFHLMALLEQGLFNPPVADSRWTRACRGCRISAIRRTGAAAGESAVGRADLFRGRVALDRAAVSLRRGSGRLAGRVEWSA